MKEIAPLLTFVLNIGDKLARFRLSREAMARSDKNRAVEMAKYQKAMHAQRAEAAQQRREEKKKAEKEKMLSFDDPEKQRKWEVGARWLTCQRLF